MTQHLIYNEDIKSKDLFSMKCNFFKKRENLKHENIESKPTWQYLA